MAERRGIVKNVSRFVRNSFEKTESFVERGGAERLN